MSLAGDPRARALAQGNHAEYGGLAQMVERSLSMREAPGSIPGFSTLFLARWMHACVLFASKLVCMEFANCQQRAQP